MIGLIVAILMLWLLAKGISSINYVIDEAYLRIRVGKVAFRKIPIEDFDEVEVGVTIGGENWTNTLHMPTIREKGVTLYRRTGLFRRLIITPGDPDGFVTDVKAHPRYQPKSP